MSTATAYTLTYRSSRAEVWRLYWQAWRKKLWRLHALVAAAPAGLFMTHAASFAHHVLQWGGGWLAMFPLTALSFSSWPQIAFKRSERRLTVDPRGWSTRIGKRAGAKSWNDVAAVGLDENGVLLVSAGGNALIVPRRAFADEAQMRQFARDAMSWHGAARSGAPAFPDAR